MLNYIIELYFLRKASSAVIRLQRSPPYTGCLPRNDHLLRRFISVHRTPSHELPLFLQQPPPHNDILLVQSRLGCFSQTSRLFVCLFCFVFSNLFIFIVIVIRCHHMHLWRVGKLKPSVNGVKYSTLDLDFL